MADQDYLVTARKYRPSLFRELVAQEHVTETLKNAIRLDRLAHAYLFSGPRGVGKTTAARILAKAINCETPREEREDEAEPCRECDSCKAFEEGRSLNVFEMDAASNNKVDDIRELREKVRIPPQGERKKVYILDEVHMLSKSAFNALLKTLEEPPPHALFIFATTEPHKVLPTILSRCQRFDFRRIPVPKIVERLREICEAEGVEADDESLMLLARKGEGALRDALSAFDQAISLCGTTLEYGELTQALGVVDQDLYFQLTDHIGTQNTAGMLELVRHVVRSGYDLQEFLVGLAEHLRNLLVAHSLGGEALEEVTEARQSRYEKEARRFGEADLLRLLTIVGEAEEELKSSTQPRLKLETTLLKMVQLRRAADLNEVLHKIDRLEQMAEEGALPETLPGGSESPSSSSSSPKEAASTENASTDESSGATTESASDDASTSSPAPSAGETDASSDESSTEVSESPRAESSSSEDTDSSTGESAEQKDADDREGEDAPDPSVGYDDFFGTPALDKDNASGGGSPTDAEGSRSPSGDADSAKGSGPQASVVAEPPVASASETKALAAEWSSLVQAVKRDRISLGALLGEAEPVELTDEVLTIAVPKPLHRDTLRGKRRVLLQHLTATFEASIEDVQFVVDTPADEEASESQETPLSPREQLQQLRDTYPSLEVLFGEFEAEPIW